MENSNNNSSKGTLVAGVQDDKIFDQSNVLGNEEAFIIGSTDPEAYLQHVKTAKKSRISRGGKKDKFIKGEPHNDSNKKADEIINEKDAETASDDDPTLKPYGLGTMFAIASNFAIGSGILAIPHSVASNGVIVSIITLILSGIGVSIASGLYIDSLARFHALRKAGFTYKRYLEIKKREKAKKKHSSQNEDLNSVRSNTSLPLLAEVTQSEGNGEILADVKEEAGFSNSGVAKLMPENSKNDDPASSPKFDIPQTTSPEMAAIMKQCYGNGGNWVWQIIIFVYLFGCLLGYGNVVSSSLTSSIPFTILPHYKSSEAKKWVCVDPSSSTYPVYCSDSYYIWACITLVISLIMCCFDVSNQKVIQTIFTVCRYFIVGLVTVLTSVAYTKGPFDPSTPNTKNHAPYMASDVPIWHFGARELGSIIPAFVFSMTIHHSIIPIVGPVKHSQKKGISNTMHFMFIFLTIITAVSSFVCGFYFGNSKMSADLVTLNFASWNGVEFFPEGSQPVWAAIVTKILIILPPIYVITGIPLNAITLASNILELVPVRLQKKRWMIVVVRLLCTGIPVVICMFWRSLGMVISFCGLAGFFITYFFPAMINHRITDMCDYAFPGEQKANATTCNVKKSKKTKTLYTSWYNCTAIYYGYYVYGIITFALTFYSLIMDIVSPKK